MVDIAAEFAPAKESVSWAEDAIADLKALVQGFFQADCAEIVTEFDPQTGYNVQKLRLRQAPPTQFARRATEALTNTRHAFDQATFAARNVTSGKSNKSIYFPWSQSQRDLDHLLKSRGIDQRLWDTFRAHEPYPRADDYIGGDDVIRALATLANNKHTVGLAVSGYISSVRHPSIKGGPVKDLMILMPKWDPVKNEAEMIRWIGEVEIYGDYEVRFEVVFKDAGLAHPVSAIDGLLTFTEKAKAVIEDLQARCLQIQAG
ncbi:MAG: hypothetical protein ACTHOP_23325 [Mesorhizobium sp.]